MKAVRAGQWVAHHDGGGQTKLSQPRKTIPARAKADARRLTGRAIVVALWAAESAGDEGPGETGGLHPVQTAGGEGEGAGAGPLALEPDGDGEAR